MKYLEPEDSKELIENICSEIGRWGGASEEVMRKALSHGVKVALMIPETDYDFGCGGFYDEETDTVFITSDDSIHLQAYFAVHEFQHACNTHENYVMPTQSAVLLGESAFIENELRNEAKAQALSFVVAHQSKIRSVNDHTYHPLYAGIDYIEGLDSDIYVNAIIKNLRHDCLYMDNILEMYDDFVAEQDTHAHLKKEKIKPIAERKVAESKDKTR
jgi:hypothetical protein